MAKIIAFQGAPGANSDLACRAVFPLYKTLPCPTFEDAFSAVRTGKANFGMIPIENSVAGRVADVHYLLPESKLYIVGEYFLPIYHHLLGVAGAKLSDIKRVESHIQALAQCRRWLRRRRIEVITHVDTAGAAADIAKRGDKTTAAIATGLAGKLYGLQSLASNIADTENNTTRFVILSKTRKMAHPSEPCITTIVFRLRSLPAALYKALGGFATNGVNITKIESYLVDGLFTMAQFRLDFDGHLRDASVARALNELSYHTSMLRILGTYPAFRVQTRKAGLPAHRL